MKNRILLLLAVVTTSVASAQLTVRNSSYIFVDGSGFTDTAGVAPLYVTNEINLTETDSRIYLRNEAQVLQGSETSNNSGLGQLSVFQTGTANNFAYNYWCSPVGNNSMTTGNENSRVNLIDGSTGLISSSDALFTTAHDGTSVPLTISNRWLYSYITSDEYSEWITLDETSPILPGLGFTMKGIESGGQLYDFRGKPNNGTISNAIAADQFTLIGNPYASALDALDFIHDPQNTYIDTDGTLAPATTGALYYWEQTPTTHFTSDYVGGYGAYTISAGGMESYVFPTFFAYDAFGNALPAPPGPTSSKVARRYIPIGQGFMVEGSSTTPSGSLVYVKNAHREFAKESSGNSYFFRDGAPTENMDYDAEQVQYDTHGLNIIPDDFKRFRLNVIFNNEYTRQLLQNFHDSATDGFDYGLEAPSSDDSLTDVSWVQEEDEPYVIQAHSFDIEKKIPLLVKAENQQPLEFSIFDIQNFDESQPIYIHDIEAGLYVDLRTQNYSINLLPGEYRNRFEITFSQNTLTTEDITDTEFDVFQNTKSAELTILNPNGLNIKSISLYDIAGKRVINALNIGNQNEYHYSTKSLSEGVYVATISVLGNKKVSKKVIIKN